MIICLDQFINHQNPNELFIIKGFIDNEQIGNKFVEEFKKAASFKKVNVDVKDASYLAGGSRRFV